MSKLNILIVGNGGREQALLFKIKQSSLCTYCATTKYYASQPKKEVWRIMHLCKTNNIDLVVIGPDEPIANGLTDDLTSAGILVFGPTKLAAKLEWSKVYAKKFMHTHHIPTADFKVVRSKSSAQKAVTHFGFPVVMKADGLAKGKGVHIIKNDADLTRAIDEFFTQNKFGDASNTVIIEEFLHGIEFSITAVCDGKSILVLPSTMDYKQIGEGDTGDMTGGMGSHSPAGILDNSHFFPIHDIINSTIQGLRAEDIEYRGVLYLGMILTTSGMKVIEYNCRFGDPECQSIILRLGKDNDIVPILHGCASGDMSGVVIDRNRFKKAAACIVLSSNPYPKTPIIGEAISGIDTVSKNTDIQIFHAGTKSKKDTTLTDSGRVLNVCTTSNSLQEALTHAYNASDKVSWSNKYYRRDIGHRVL